MDEAISLLQPLCVQLISKPSPGVDELKRLLVALQSLDVTFLQPIQNYILYPLEILLRQIIEKPENKNDIATVLLQCAQQVFNVVKIDNIALFRNWFIWICLLGASPNGSRKVSDISEELKIEITHTLTSLLLSASTAVAESYLDDSFSLQVAHAVSVLLDLAQLERHVDLRVYALKCLQLLLHPKDATLSLKTVARLRSSMFLPGVTTATCKIATSDSKINHRITVEAVKTCQQVLVDTLDDSHVDSIISKQQSSCSVSGLKPSNKVSTSDWLSVTSGRIQLLIDKLLSSLMNHSSWLVRLAAGQLATDVVLKCTGSLSSSMPSLVSCLVTLTCDELRTVSDCAIVSLKQLLVNRSNVMEVCLEDIVHNLSSTLPRSMESLSESERRTAVKCICGALQVLGDKIVNVLSSSVHLPRCTSALLHSLQFDCAVQSRIHALGPGPDQTKPWYHYKHFSEPATYAEFQKICHILIQYGNAYVLIDHLICRMHESSTLKLQAIWMLNELIAGIKLCADKKALDVENMKSLISQVTSEYCDNLTSLRIGTHGDYGSSSWEEKQAKMMEVCLLLDGIGKCAEMLQKDFNVHLIEALYLVMERAGDCNEHIQKQVELTLATISHAMSYSSESDLLSANSDYLVNDISLRLRHYYQYPEVPLVLKSLLLHSGPAILPYVDDVIGQLINLLDDQYLMGSESFMDVLYTLVNRIHLWFLPDKTQCSLIGNKKEADDARSCCNLKLCEIGQWLKNYHELHVRAETLDNDNSRLTDIISTGNCDSVNDNECENSDVNFEEKEEVKKKDLHILLTLKICDRSRHLLSSSELRIQILCMDVITLSCDILRNNQDDLLPLVHSLWPSLQLKFSGDANIIYKAFLTLYKMAETCGDFIRQRTVRDILLKLTSLLSNSASKSLQAGPMFKYSPLCKTQKLLLCHLIPLCKQIDTGENQLTSLIQCHLPYLSDKQPLDLQEASIEGMRCLALWYPDYLWWKLVNIYCPYFPSPPHSCLPYLQIKENLHSTDFAKNISLLLNLL